MKIETISHVSIASHLAGLVTLAFIVSFDLWGFEASPFWLIPLVVTFVVAEIAMAVLRRRLRKYDLDD